LSVRFFYLFPSAFLLLPACDGSDVEERTDPCPPGAVGCPCAEAPACDAGLVCDAVDRLCRAPIECAEVTCLAHQACADPESGLDARCIEDCEIAWTWDPIAGKCEAVPPTCGGGPTSIAAECADANRECIELGGARCGRCLAEFMEPVEAGAPCLPAPTCDDATEATCGAEGRVCRGGTCAECVEGRVDEGGACVLTNCSTADIPGALGEVCAMLLRGCEESAGGASCDACLPEHVEDGEGCRPAETCTSLDCVGLNRGCDEAGDEARCGDCRAGFRDVGGRCTALQDALCDGEAGLEAACAAESRLCDPDGPDGARCGGCVVGHVEHPAPGGCIEPQGCDAIDCAARSRRCEPTPTAACTDCLEGTLEDAAGFCRQPLGCGELECGALDCVEAPEGAIADARCVTPCEDTQLWNGRECAPCPACDRPGEVGREGRPTAAGWCICETEPGWFYSVANDVGAVPCDADGDGWVRESARRFVDGGDPVLRDNARCGLRSIDRITLHTAEDATRDVLLDASLGLYESVRNDDDAALEEAWRRAQLPTSAWGPGAAGVRANLLNPFTKLCHDARTDYNDNGLADVYEHGAADLAPGYRADQAPFVRFSYFLELHRGWFEALGADPSVGAWHVAERARDPDDGQEVPVRYPGEETGWRTCQRRPDPAVDVQDPPVGLDFSELAPEGDWPGMNHHSQFKCLVVLDVPDPAQPAERTPAEADADFVVNRCRASAAPVPVEGNPAEPRFTCSTLDVLPTTGSTVWAAVPYTAYPSNPVHAGYAGGCVNACAEALRRHEADNLDLLCPGLPVNRPSCLGQLDDYGSLECVEVQCDQIDNDGDGATDEDPAPTCATGLLGVCATGAPRCDGTTLLCDPPPETDEICNGLDDDCDGVTDEETNDIPCAAESPSFGLPADPDLAGVCHNRVTLCSDGILDCIPNPVDLYEPVDELSCDGLDNDCDGQTDEQLLGTAIPEGAGVGNFGEACVGDPAIQGVCAAQTWQCAGGEALCQPAVEPALDGCGDDAPRGCFRVCDGLDNDCDGQTDEDNACLRTWSGSLQLNPILRRDDDNMGGSRVTANIGVDFGGVGTDELEVAMEIELLEQYHRPTEAYIERTVSTHVEGTVQEVVGGQRYAETYIDGDDATDILKDQAFVPNPANNPFEGNVQSVTDHPGVTLLHCTARVSGNDDVVSAEQAFTRSRAFCDLRFTVDYIIVPPAHPCLGEPTEEVCDGGDNDCDGMVDEQGRPVPDRLELTFGGETRFGAGDELWATVFDDEGGEAEQELLRGGSLDFVQAPGFLRHSFPIGQPTRVTVPGNTLELRFVSAGGRIEIRRVTDREGNRLEVPADLGDLQPGETSERYGYGDGLGLGQICGDTEGACELGRRVCQDGGAVCLGGIEPIAEEDACNGVDEDCDGAADEGVREPCAESCGAGTRACGGGACLSECAERCGIVGYRRCTPGAEVFGACEYDFPEEVCDGEDNDCDDLVDETFDVEGVCFVGVGECRREGVVGCVEDGTEACSVVAGAPGLERCNGLDDDCNGLEDDGLAPRPADFQEGVCGGALQTCDGANGFVEPDYGGLDDYEPEEHTCDGLDNDCDGNVDEGRDLDAAPQANLQEGVCAGAVQICNGGWVDPAGYGDEYEADETSCDGLDNDCDGDTDEDPSCP